MSSDRAPRPHPHRRGLTLLTVIASFALLSRQPEAGRLSGMISVMGALAGNESVRMVMPSRETPTVIQASSRSLARINRTVTFPTPHAPAVLWTSAPHAPPATHDHTAHCPFCSTASFTTDTTGVVLSAPVVRPSTRLPAPEEAGVARSTCAVAGPSDLVTTGLPDSPQVQDVLRGEHRVAEGLKRGGLYSGMSRVAPGAARTAPPARWRRPWGNAA